MPRTAGGVGVNQRSDRGVDTDDVIDRRRVGSGADGAEHGGIGCAGIAGAGIPVGVDVPVVCARRGLVPDQCPGLNNGTSQQSKGNRQEQATGIEFEVHRLWGWLGVRLFAARLNQAGFLSRLSNNHNARRWPKSIKRSFVITTGSDDDYPLHSPNPVRLRGRDAGFPLFAAGPPVMLARMNTLVLATRNAHKVGEIQAILGDGFRCLTLNEFPGAPVVVEDAATFAGNATKKAIEIGRWLSEMRSAECGVRSEKTFVLADDSGLEVDALKGAPGVHSARFAALDSGQPRNSPTAANNAKLLRLLKDVPPEKRTARFRCVMALTPVIGERVESASPVCRSEERRVGKECRSRWS